MPITDFLSGDVVSGWGLRRLLGRDTGLSVGSGVAAIPASVAPQLAQLGKRLVQGYTASSNRNHSFFIIIIKSIHNPHESKIQSDLAFTSLSNIDENPNPVSPMLSAFQATMHFFDLLLY